MNRRLACLIIGGGALALFCAAIVGMESWHSNSDPGVLEIGSAPSVHIPRIEQTAARAQPVPVRTDATNVGSLPVDGAASGDIFDPFRGSADAAPTGPPPLLFGVVAGGGVKSRAYIEDPETKGVHGYQIGDTVAGWRLEQIREDRVVIAGARRAVLEVLLRDPVKPRPALLDSTAVTSEAHAAAPARVETPPVEASAPPARAASLPSEYRETAPRIVGPIPAQLFRPARLQAKTSE